MTGLRIKRACFPLVISLLLGVSPLAADEKTDLVDKLFARWDTTVTPGAALAVIKDGRIIYTRGYGMAKLEDGLVMTPSKIFDIGSVSKQFTAACLAFLVREGKVGLDDDIRKHIPELPRYEKPITVRHLLHHTSGLRDYNELLWLAGFRPSADCPTVEESLQVICSQKKLNYSPGEEYSYTNTGYFLLGVIVERTSGQSLNAFAQERIFKPLGMTSTLYQDDHTQVIKNRATGYSPLEGEKGYRLDLSDWDEVGDGNVYTSAEDLFRWDQALAKGTLGPEIMDMMLTLGTLNDGRKLDYAWGLRIADYKGLRTIGHGGSWAGFRAGYLRFPQQDFAVICLANLSTISVESLCRKVADIYLADLLTKKPAAFAKTPKSVKWSKDKLEALAGNWQEERFGQWITLGLAEGRLTARAETQDYPLTPVSETLCLALDASRDVSVEFVPPVEGQPWKARLNIDGETLVLTQNPAHRPLSADELREYAGDYVCPELLGAVYRLSAVADGLSLRTRILPPSTLKAMASDKFTVEDLNIDFARDPDGRVSGFRLSVGRVAGLEFMKLGVR